MSLDPTDQPSASSWTPGRTYTTCSFVFLLSLAAWLTAAWVNGQALERAKDVASRYGDAADGRFDPLFVHRLLGVESPESNCVVIGLSSEFGDDDLRILAGLRSVTILDLTGTNVSATGLCELSRFPTLSRLGLDRVTDADLTVLTDLSVTELSLSGKGITDSGILVLAKMRNLQLIELKSTSVTESGISSFKALHPSVRCYLSKVTEDGE